MSGTGQAELTGLLIFFLALDAAAVGLRLYVRLGLKKSAFGLDDIFLIGTYVSPSSILALLRPL